MPPIVPVPGSTFAAWNAGAGSFSVLTPTDVSAGDALLLIVVYLAAADPTTTIDGAAFAAGGWMRVQTITASHVINIYRRIVTSTEPASHTGTFTAATNGAAALVAFRQMDASVALSAVAMTDDVAALNHVCASQTLAAFTDMFLGVVYINGEQALTGQTTLLQGNDGTSSLLVFMVEPDVTGATGTFTATTSANRNGASCSTKFSALAAVVGKSAIPDIAGALGFTTTGV